MNTLSSSSTLTAILLILLTVNSSLYPQSVQEIKSDRASYLWGEGTGMTLKEADNEALEMLINQISVQVESKFTHLIDETEKSGNGSSYNYVSKVNSVVKSYSNATLHNTERIVITNEPDATVFRYIKRADVKKVFENRYRKITEFIKNALTATSQVRTGDALRYYYWALTLLKSHPGCNNLTYTGTNQENHLLISWLPTQISNLFAHLRFEPVGQIQTDECLTVHIQATTGNTPVTNLDYSYWDGRDWSPLIHMKDGRGIVELLGAAAKTTEQIRIKVEYIYDTQANIDQELKNTMERITPIPFRECYFTVSLTESPDKELSKNAENNAPTPDTTVCAKTVKAVMEAVAAAQYESAKEYFTTDGYNVYEKLVAYGNAKPLPPTTQDTFSLDGVLMVRSFPMVFSFKNNNQKFVEDVVFHFNRDGKIENLTFGLSQKALQSILEKDSWDKTDRLILINFLENYKTAYALKRLKYIESVFADDALIITGKVIKLKPSAENPYRNNQIVQYNRQSKAGYIQNLRHSFNSKEYINIRFEDSEIKKGSADGHIYGIQIKQNYFSSNYGDQGYLFLMVDLTLPSEPVIHVRTWQPAQTGQDIVYGLSDF